MIFSARKNIIPLAISMYNTYYQEGGRVLPREYFRLILRELDIFIEKKNYFLGYQMASAEVIKFNDITEVINAINEDFRKYISDKIHTHNTFNPFREWARVGPSHNRIEKRFRDLNNEDMQTLDYWRPFTIYSNNTHYRRNNVIPFYRATIHKRNYDKSNEGLVERDPNRASLNNFQRCIKPASISLNVSKKDAWW